MATPHGLNEYAFDRISTGDGKLGGIKELSRSNELSIKTSFPAGKIIWDRVRPDITTLQQQLLLDGEVENGFCMTSTFNRNYHENNPPDTAGMQANAGPGGDPGSAFTPNTASPGVGSTDASTMPAPPAWMADPLGNKDSRPPFNGAMTDTDPMTTSTAIAGTKVETLGSLMGRSNARVDPWGAATGFATETKNG